MSSTSLTPLFGVYAVGLVPALVFAGPAAQGYLLHRPAAAAVVTNALTDAGNASAFIRAKD